MPLTTTSPPEARLILVHCLTRGSFLFQTTGRHIPCPVPKRLASPTATETHANYGGQEGENFPCTQPLHICVITKISRVLPRRPRGPSLPQALLCAKCRSGILISSYKMAFFNHFSSCELRWLKREGCPCGILPGIPSR